MSEENTNPARIIPTALENVAKENLGKCAECQLLRARATTLEAEASDARAQTARRNETVESERALSERLRTRLAVLEAEGDKWWGILCEASDALGGPTPEKAPHVPAWIRKLNERLATLEEDRGHLTALIETIKIEYPSVARELELDDLLTQEGSDR